MVLRRDVILPSLSTGPAGHSSGVSPGVCCLSPLAFQRVLWSPGAGKVPGSAASCAEQLERRWAA